MPFCSTVWSCYLCEWYFSFVSARGIFRVLTFFLYYYFAKWKSNVGFSIFWTILKLYPYYLWLNSPQDKMTTFGAPKLLELFYFRWTNDGLINAMDLLFHSLYLLSVPPLIIWLFLLRKHHILILFCFLAIKWRGIQQYTEFNNLKKLKYTKNKIFMNFLLYFLIFYYVIFFWDCYI